MGAEETVNCEICGGAAPLAMLVANYKHFRCPSCRHLFVSPRPPRDELDRFYADASYYDSAEQQAGRLQREARTRARLLLKYCEEFKLEPRLLDVGCASGLFMSVAAGHGFSVVGQDRSPAIAERARSTHGFDVRIGTIEDAAGADEKFPVVTAWEVVEHAREPGAFLGSLTSLIKPDGLLAISTPMADGIPARILRHRNPMLCPPEHLSIFSRRSIVKLAGAFGLKCIHFSSFSNLDTRGLASGLSRVLFGKPASQVGLLQKSLCLGAAGLAAWVPRLIDRAGYGTEMLVVFRKSGE